ncbi:MAG TPA: glycosyltransferase [Chloroflexota bacterium]|nr:glycosyltransferase [Chloroflexota bacterium]
MKLSNTNHPFVSIIVPVFNDYDRLLICLQHLQHQSYPQENYEIIVVDNGSIDPVRNYPLPGHAILLEEPQIGSYAARNKGLATARGEIIAFTDSDCQPAHDWVERGVERLLSTPNCGLIGGQIKVFPQNPAKLTISEFYECLAAFPQARYVQDIHFSAGANTFTFRHVIDRVGNFLQDLKSGGDAEWGNRVYDHGYDLVYAEDVIVRHPARRSLRELWAKEVRRAGGLYDKNLPQQPTLRELVQGLMPPLFAVRRVLPGYQPLTLKENISIVFVLVFLKYAGGWETLRLRLGASSRR